MAESMSSRIEHDYGYVGDDDSSSENRRRNLHPEDGSFGWNEADDDDNMDFVGDDDNEQNNPENSYSENGNETMDSDGADFVPKDRGVKREARRRASPRKASRTAKEYAPSKKPTLTNPKGKKKSAHSTPVPPVDNFVSMDLFEWIKKSIGDYNMLHLNANDIAAYLKEGKYGQEEEDSGDE